VSDVFDVVFVCTGNRFRSPLAAAIFREAAAGLPVQVSSAGTLELGPTPALREAVEAATRFGLDLSSHRSRGLTGLDLSGVDLVVGFERHHVAAAVVEANAPRGRTFTLPELVELLAGMAKPRATDPLHRARELVAGAGEKRGDPAQSDMRELEDPIGLPGSDQREIADQIRELTEQLAKALFRS
jgi:protein-tyrosine-phosphatase